MPEFSWDTVPRYMHVRKAKAFTPEEIDYLATFPLITFEKTTGIEDFGSTEAGTEKAAKAVKKINPDAKILYYRNIIVHYSCYHADKQLEDIAGAFLEDKNGNTKLVRNRVQAYDLSNPKVQDWWLDNAKWVCSLKNIDGVFIDGNIKALESGYLLRQIGEEKKNATMEGYHSMMQQLPGVIGKDGLTVANVIRARFNNAGLEYVDYFDGSYIEGFEYAVNGVSKPDYVAKGIDAIQTAARDGKIIAFTIGTGGYADTDMDKGQDKLQNVKKSPFQERLTYTLSLFLVCAEEYSYFMISGGYGAETSKLWMKDIPEFSKPLGPPKGPAQKRGYVYKRAFEHADVTVDIENETAEIIWKGQ